MQSENAPLFIVVTLSGGAIFPDRFEHDEKLPVPITSSKVGCSKSKELRLEQWENAPESISFNCDPSSILTLLNPPA